MTRIRMLLSAAALALLSLAAQAQSGAVPPAGQEPAARSETPGQGTGVRRGTPSLHDVQKVAREGDLARARSMVDELLARQPDNARAHYVKAQLAARDRDAAVARSELERAEQLAPGLPFARTEAVAALRKRVDRIATARGGAPGQEARRDAPAADSVNAARQDASAAGTPAPQGSATSSRHDTADDSAASKDTRSMGARDGEGLAAGKGSLLLAGAGIGAVAVLAISALLRRRRPSSARDPGAPGP